MVTVTFDTKKTNGVIPIPDQYQNQINEGTELKVIVLVKSSANNDKDTDFNNEDDRRKRLNELFGTWENDQNLVEVFAEIDKQRHEYLGRNIENFEVQKLN